MPFPNLLVCTPLSGFIATSISLPLAIDLIAEQGAVFEASFAAYRDDRVLSFRGQWQEWRVYSIGESVVLEDGSAWVATLETQHARPGAPGFEPFWSPLKPRGLTGAELELVVGTAFTQKIEPSAEERTAGKFSVELEPKTFEAIRSSERFLIKVVPSGEEPEYLVVGTFIAKGRP